jgi:ABC-type multidrug transport system fused ATPase/permease subunit
MTNLKKILDLFDKKEKKALVFLSFLVFFSIFLEMFSLAIIVPVFNIIFVDHSSWLNLFINNIQLLKSTNFKIIILVILVFIFFFKNVYLIILNFFVLKFFSSFQEKVSNKLFLQHLNNDQNIIYDKNSLNLLKKVVQDTDGLRIYLIAYQNLFIEIIFLFFLFLLLLFYNYQITIFFSLIFCIVIFSYLKLIKNRIINWSAEYQGNLIEINSTVIEGVKGIKDIIIYNLKEIFFSYFSKISKNKILAEFKLNLINGTQRFWMEIIAIFGVVIPLIIYIFFDKPVVGLIPVFALFTASLFRILPSFNRIIMYYNNLKFYQPCLESIHNTSFNFIPPSNLLRSNNTFFFNKSLNLKNISFQYNDKSISIFDNITLDFPKGQCSIILGDNGSGKSTILNIISGLLLPNSGQVLIDNSINIHESRSEWLKHISYVQQDVFLLNKTIKENITLNFNDSYEIEKYNLIKKMLLLEKVFIKINDKKLDANTGLAGSTLSGGQKQLISIARALYKNADIFLFDEASSALDLDYQKILKDVINYLKCNNKTIIIITHDLYLFKEFADNIFKIEFGKIIRKN